MSDLNNNLDTLFGPVSEPAKASKPVLSVNYDSKTNGSLALVDLPTFSRIDTQDIELEKIKDPMLKQIYLDSSSLNENVLEEIQFKKQFKLAQVNNQLLRFLQLLCVLCVVFYSIDVFSTYDVSKLEEKTRRIVEQNCELSAKLLKIVSFQGIQDNLVGRFGLCVPENVIIANTKVKTKIPKVKPRVHFAPIISGY